MILTVFRSLPDPELRRFEIVGGINTFENDSTTPDFVCPTQNLVGITPFLKSTQDDHFKYGVVCKLTFVTFKNPVIRQNLATLTPAYDEFILCALK